MRDFEALLNEILRLRQDIRTTRAMLLGAIIGLAVAVGYMVR